MTVREANLTASSSADREPELIETAGTARLHLTLATAAFQSIRARETCGVFISSAAAGAAISKTRPTSTARFNPASLVLPRQRRLGETPV